MLSAKTTAAALQEHHGTDTRQSGEPGADACQPQKSTSEQPAQRRQRERRRIADCPGRNDARCRRESVDGANWDIQEQREAGMNVTREAPAVCNGGQIINGVGLEEKIVLVECLQRV